MNNDPNSRQVGGSHYRGTSFQHWDLMALANANYFAGQITKYTERHALKNGKQDLEKALHFAEKMHSVQPQDSDGSGPIQWFSRQRVPHKEPVNKEEIQEAIRDYSVDAGLTAIQERIFEYCLLNPNETGAIVSLCRRHLERVYPSDGHPEYVEAREVIRIPAHAFGATTGAPGTPEDGGHHHAASEVEETVIIPDEVSALVENGVAEELEDQIKIQKSAEVMARKLRATRKSASGE